LPVEGSSIEAATTGGSISTIVKTADISDNTTSQPETSTAMPNVSPVKAGLVDGTEDTVSASGRQEGGNGRMAEYIRATGRLE
jgi:hypothetical protein